MKKFCILFFIFPLTVFAQRTVNLDQALEIAFTKSYDIKSSKSSYDISRLQLEASKLGLYTSVDMTFSLPNYYSTLRREFNSATQTYDYFRTEENQLKGNLIINQPIIFTNGKLSLNGTLEGSRRFNQANKENYYTNLYINFIQPLFSFNNLAADLRKNEISELTGRKNFTNAEFDLIYKVTLAFYNLYKTKKQFEIKSEEVKQKESSYETALSKYKAGMIAEVEALKLEVELAQSRNGMLDFKRSYEDLKNEFKLLIGMDLTEEINVETILDFNSVDINEQEMITLALKNRADLYEAEFQIESKQLELDETDAQRSIKFELNASYGLNKNTPFRDQLFKDLSESRQVSLNVNVPLWDWGSHRRRVEAGKIGFEQTKDRYEYLKKSVVKEIISAVNRINSAKESVEVLKKSVSVAEKSYEISIERFKVGKINSFELSQIQLNLTQAKLESLNAIIQYKLALADLERKTLTKIVK